MTSQQETAAVIAGGLTTGEREALLRFKHGDATWAEQETLIKLGLLQPVDIADNGYTPLGNLVLAALEAPQAKPDVISAREFVEQGFAEKVAKGECVVTDLEGNNVISMSTEKDFNDVYAVLVETLEIPVNGWVDEYSSDAKFSVTWLDTAPAPDGNGGGGDWQWGFNFPTNIQAELDDIDRKVGGSVYTTFIRAYIAKQEAELTALRSQLAAANERAATAERIIEQATHYSKVELPVMSETAQLAWLHSMRGHVLDILQGSEVKA